MLVTSQGQEGHNDGAVLGVDSCGQHRAKPHATAGGEVDEPFRPAIEEYDATSACAIGGRDGEIGIQMRNRTMNLSGATK